MAAGVYPPEGPRQAVFGPLAFLGRTGPRAWVATLVALALTAALFAVSLSEAPEALWLMFIVGLMIGYFGRRRRSNKRWLQIAVSTVLPCALALFFATISQLLAAAIASTVVIPAAVLGHFIARGVESVFGPRRKVLQASWRGVVAVGGDPHGNGVRFDVRPLTEQVSKNETREMRQLVKRSELDVRSRVLKGLFIVAAPILLIVIITGFIDEATKGGDDVAGQLVGFSAVVTLLIVGYGVIGYLGFRGSRHTTSLADHVRYAKFAGINGFDYYPGPRLDKFGRQVSRTMAARSGRPWVLGNATRNEQNPAESSAPLTMFNGFCEIQMGVPLPNFLLMSRKRRLPSFSAHAAPSRSQRLSLEGDFDRYFQLYCPKGYEQDALYILTPDVLANLIDSAAGFDVEFIDDGLVLRTRSDMVTVDPAQWQRIAVAVNALSARLQQWERWRDDRLADEVSQGADLGKVRLITEKPTGVALAGRRLSLGVSLGAILIAGYIAVYGALVWIANAL